MAYLSTDVAAILHSFLFFDYKKILKITHFAKKRDGCNDLFIKITILYVYQLHLYELLNFVLKSLNGYH